MGMNGIRPLARRGALLAATAAVAALAGLSACSEKASFSGVDITGADYAQAFDLVDFNGRERTLADFKGKVVVMFFGYTQCPDVCPTTMAELAQAKQLLGAEGDKVQGLFVSIDPERDTPPVMKQYVTGFDPSFLALYAKPGELPAVAKAFKVYYKKVEGKTPSSYTMDHSAGSYVYDAQGHLRIYERYGVGPKALAGDLRQLLDQPS